MLTTHLISLWSVAAALVLGLSGTVQAQTMGGTFTGPGKRGIDVTAEPNYHLLLDNAFVRAFRVEIQPGKSTELHWHDYDYMVVTLEDSTVGELVMRTNEKDARKHELRSGEMAVVELKKKFGDIFRTRGGVAHTLSNKMDKPYRNVTLELKRGNSQVSDGEALVLRPGEHATKEWMAAGHLLVPMIDCVFKDDTPDRESKTYRLHTGEVVWIPSGLSHLFSAISDPAIITTIEFK